jgi:uncharacterized membrane protein YhaH (DUF805 family)
MFKNVFTYNGRIRRLEYAFSYVIYLCFYYGALEFLNLDTNLWIVSSDEQSKIIMGFICLIIIPFIIIQGIKRCHDIEKSGWWVLVPIFNPLWLLFREGSKGDNSYGVSPELDEIQEINMDKNFEKSFKITNQNNMKKEDKIIYDNIEYIEDDILYNNIVDLINNQEFNKADNLLNNAIQTFPENNNYKRLRIIISQIIADNSKLFDLYNQADEYYKNNDFDGALNKINELIKIDPHPNNLSLKKLIDEKIAEINDNNLKLNEAFYFHENNDFNKAYFSLNEYLVNNPSQIDNNKITNVLIDCYNNIIQEIENLINNINLQAAINHINNIKLVEESSSKKNDQFVLKLNTLKDKIETLAIEKSNHFRENNDLESYITMLNIALECAPNKLQYMKLINENKRKVSLKNKKDKTKKILIVALSSIIVISILGYFYNYNNELTKWNKIKNDNSIKIYEDYIKGNPKSDYLSLAKIALDSLLTQDSIFFQNVISINNIENYLTYLEKQKEGKYREEVLYKLESLLWKKCLKDKSIEAYQDYISYIKEGEHLNEANIEYNRLKLLEQDVEESIYNDVKNQIESYFSAFCSQNYDELLLYLSPKLDRFYGVYNIPKIKVVQIESDYKRSKQIFDEKYIIDYSSFKVKYIDNDKYKATFNMDYFLSKNDIETNNTIRQYYNINFEILINNDLKIYSIKDKVVSKDLNYLGS